jgi:hypothetical protein
MDYAFPPGATDSLVLKQFLSFLTSDATNCPLTTIKTFDSSGSTEEASATYDAATFTVDGSSKVTTTKKIRAYSSDGTSYVEGTLNVHICGDETI